MKSFSSPSFLFVIVCIAGQIMAFAPNKCTSSHVQRTRVTSLFLRPNQAVDLEVFFKEALEEKAKVNADMKESLPQEISKRVDSEGVGVVSWAKRKLWPTKNSNEQEKQLLSLTK